MRLGRGVIAGWLLLGCGGRAPRPVAELPPQVAPAVAPPVGSPPVAVGLAAGDFHSCALLADGRVACWGTRWPGGDIYALRERVADRVRWSTPALVAGVSDAASIDAEGAQTCVVTRSGQVACWSELAQAPWREPARPVAGVDAVVQVAVSAASVCARRQDGSVSCWTPGTPPRRVTGLPAVVELTAGPAHACARDLAGQVYCWGDGSHGQLGGAATSAVPVTIPVRGARALAAGASMTCAARAAGPTVCWGERWIGDPHRSRPTELVPPSETWGADHATALVAGGGSTCGFVAGQVQCWSWGGEGESMLGYRASQLPAGVRGLALGATHACALEKDGQVVCWGENALGQLGDGGNHDGTRPVAVLGLTDARAVRAGRRFTCALQAAGGVSCWGWNVAQELGDGSRKSQGRPARVAGLADVRYLASGSEASCAVLASGGVRCWGDNQLGTLGDGSEAQRAGVVDVKGMADAVAVDVTLGHLGVVRAGGDVMAWGRHDNGLVSGAKVASIPGARSLVVNQWGYTCALAGSRVACFGAALADRSATRNWTVTDQGIDAVDLAMFDSVACAATAGGRVACWSDGDDNWAHVTATPALRGDVFDAVGVAVGGSFACAVLRGGKVTCWGDNSSGQLGNGSYQAAGAVTVAGLGDAVSVDAGEDHACAVRRGGAVVCWGDDAQGQLGDGLAGGPPPWSSGEALPVTGLARLR